MLLAVVSLIVVVLFGLGVLSWLIGVCIHQGMSDDRSW